jgi:hypothetical protein
MENQCTAHEAISNTVSELLGMRELLEQTHGLVTKIDVALIGTYDTPGLISKLHEAEAKIVELEAQFKRVKGFVLNAAIGIGSMFGMSVIGFLWALLTHTIQIVNK